MIGHELRRTAHHESGHAVAEWALGFRLQIVSIRAHERYAGFAAFERLPFAIEGWDPSAGVSLAPHQLRLQVERHIVVLLAGAIAERLAGPPPADAPVIPLDEQDALDAAQHVARLAPRHRELLERHEANLSANETSDTSEAERLTQAFAGDDADAYLGWLAKVAARLVHDNRRLIAALAAELLTHTVLPGDDAERIIEAATWAGRKGIQMPSLVRKKAVDATGTAIAAEKLYVPVVPYATHDRKVYGDSIELLGSDPAVLAVPTRWIRTDAGSAAKGAALAAHRARGMASLPPAPPDLSAPRILQAIPKERRRVALQTYHDRSGRMFDAGSIHDANDAFVQANPSLFAPETT